MAISGRFMISSAVGFRAGQYSLQASPSPDLMAHILPVELTKEQVENSRDVDTVMPVYRQRMGDLSRDWPLYWGGGRLLVAGMTGKKKSPIEKQESDLHLRSTREVTGYRIQAIDGSIGHVEGFIVDCETWSIRYVVIDTRNWLPGKKVLVATQWVGEVCWSKYRFHVGIRNLPARSL